MSTIGERALLSLPVLHETIDTRVAELEARHRDRLKCAKGCSQCCVDALTVSEVEAEHIRRAVGDDLRGQAAHLAGACAFLDGGGACRIYSARPYVCRTQGLPLRWIEGETERRDICPLNESGEPLESLAEAECFTVGPVEQRLALLQSLRPSDERVPLRGLFEELARRD